MPCCDFLLAVQIWIVLSQITSILYQPCRSYSPRIFGFGKWWFCGFWNLFEFVNLNLSTIPHSSSFVYRTSSYCAYVSKVGPAYVCSGVVVQFFSIHLCHGGAVVYCLFKLMLHGGWGPFVGRGWQRFRITNRRIVLLKELVVRCGFCKLYFVLWRIV